MHWAVGGAEEQDGDGVGGVGGVRGAGDGVAHQFGVAVVGGDQEPAVPGGDGGLEAAEAGVDGFDGADGGGQAAGVADHVGVGVVEDEEGVLGGFDGADGGVGEFGGGHLGLQVVGGDVWRGVTRGCEVR